MLETFGFAFLGANLLWGFLALLAWAMSAHSGKATLARLYLWMIFSALAACALMYAQPAHAEPGCYLRLTKPTDEELCRIPKIECFVGVPWPKQEALCGTTLTKRKLDTLFRQTVICGAEVWSFCASGLPFRAVDAMRTFIDVKPPEKKP
jgi:hypothetical protein